VVLAHGARFNKASWAKQAEVLAKTGFRVLAIDFRGYGKSRGGDQSSPGGGAAATALIHARPGEIDAWFCWLTSRWRSPSGLLGQSYS
jgi:pimeloyl-ACP methyl ester carboxylesterase